MRNDGDSRYLQFNKQDEPTTGGTKCIFILLMEELLQQLIGCFPIYKVLCIPGGCLGFWTINSNSEQFSSQWTFESLVFLTSKSWIYHSLDIWEPRYPHNLNSLPLEPSSGWSESQTSGVRWSYLWKKYTSINLQNPNPSFWETCLLCFPKQSETSCWLQIQKKRKLQPKLCFPARLAVRFLCLGLK